MKLFWYVSHPGSYNRSSNKLFTDHFQSTGLTGYIGGDFLYVISKSHPEWQVSSLFRSATRAEPVLQSYSQVRAVSGDLESSALIEEEASKADVVYHFASCDHIGSAKAIAAGLARRKSDKPRYWIHTSGCMILALDALQTRAYGKYLEKEFNDWEGVQELVIIPDSAPHRQADKIVLAAASDHVKTAIVCPSTLYGEGRGEGNPRSMQINEVVRIFLMLGEAFKVEGANVWHEIHVQDLTDLYIRLGESTVNGEPATWNEKGYYLSENGSFAWGDICQAIAEIGHEKGYLKSPNAVSLSSSEVASIWPRFNSFMGCSSRGQAIRGKNLLGWKPHHPSLREGIARIIDQEAEMLSLAKDGLKKSEF